MGTNCLVMSGTGVVSEGCGAGVVSEGCGAGVVSEGCTRQGPAKAE